MLMTDHMKPLSRPEPLHFRSATVDHPPAPRKGLAQVERRAKLFEAGTYEDKGVTITPDHLSALATSFRPVPILVEHQPSPLDLGHLAGVEAHGAELYGTLAFSTEAHALVERSGARSLSIGLSADLTEIREVSLVRNPRVASAQIFSADTIRFFIELPPDRRARDAEAARQVEGMVREGRIAPAQVDAARRLLASDDLLPFDDQQISVSAMFRHFLDLAPTANLFSKVARTGRQEYSDSLLLPEEAEFYRRHFPDVSLRDIAGQR